VWFPVPIHHDSEAAMSKSKHQLEALLDREAIRDLPLRYCDHVWMNDIPGILKLFAKDGEFIMVVDGNETAAKGHAAMSEIYKQGFAIQPRPYIHNHVVELIDDKHAHGRCYLALHSAKQNMAFIGAGHYADTYVKVKGEWKFQRRYFTALRMDDNPVESPPAGVPVRASTRKRPARRAKTSR